MNKYVRAYNNIETMLYCSPFADNLDILDLRELVERATPKKRVAIYQSLPHLKADIQEYSHDSCPNCKSEDVEDFNFCPDCGQRLE